MKTTWCLISLLAVLIFSATAQRSSAEDAGYQIAERGPHHRTWSRVSWETNRQGEVMAVTNAAFTELETGMHFLRDGQWLESQAKIELLDEGAAATNGAHSAYFSANVNDTNALVVVAPDGRIFRSRVYGLAYFDPSSGRAVLIAETKDSIGLLVGDNEVLYTNAFDGVEADVQYFYTKAGLEQNIVAREQLPPPSLFGLSDSAARLQVLSEFEDPPVPTKTTQLLDANRVDERLDFGAMMMGRGRAFSVDVAGAGESSVPVTKQWGEASGRTFLVEEVPYNRIQEQILALERKKQGALLNLPRKGQGATMMAALQEVLPRRTAKTRTGKMKLAQLDAPKRPGFVLDYTLMSNQTNYTFNCDITYYVSGTCNLIGTTTIEGGAIIKYTNHTTAKLSLSSGALVCKTEAYRPAVFTSKDDNTVGDTIPGSTGTPTNYNGGTYLESLETIAYQHLRMSYAGTAIDGFFGYPSDVWHCQFLRCGTAITASDNADIRLHNVLFSQCATAVKIDSANSLAGEHVTADRLNKFFDAPFITGVLTNSILTAVTNIGTNVALYFCTTNSIGSEIYQTVGAGGYYLADGSTNRNAGTTNINSSLLAGLKQRTTYPPIVFSNAIITSDLYLYPQAQRDTDAPDLGYHYDPLDYAFGRSVASNATVTLAAGTAVGTFSTSSTYGLGLLAGSGLHTEGTAIAPVWIVRSQMAQEQANDAWTNNYGQVSIQGNWLGGTAPNVQCRFTKFSAAANSTYHFKDYNQAMPIWFKDCEFFGGKFVVAIASPYLTNNLFARVATAFEDLEYGPVDASVHNCLFYGGTFYLTHLDAGNMVFRDNLFAGTYLVQDGDVDNANDGYTANTNRLSPTNAHDVVAGLTFQNGPLGWFYQPTNSAFINVGSVTNAGLAGLYHYTVLTNQVAEAYTTNDIGFHYVATDGGGIPTDTDGDGVSDYLEDRNGSGTVESGETDWNDLDDPGLRVLITRPSGGGPLP